MNRKNIYCMMGLLAVSSIVFAGAKPYEEVYADRKMSRADKNKNGQLEKEENPNEWKKYHRLDVNGDDVITLDELAKVDIPYLETGGERKLNILYKETSEEDLYLDFYYPTAKRTEESPVVFYTHGGGWGAGDKQGAANYLNAPVFKQLADQGFCVVAVNYRLCKQGGPYVSECVIDCKDAMRYVAKNRKALGVNSERFYVMGGSAGGHLAQMLLLTPPEAQPGDSALADAAYKMVAGVSWYGFTNVELDDLFFPERGKKEPKRGTTGRIIPRGSSPEQARAILREMSPTSWLTKESPPLLVIHGDKDTAVSVEHAYYIQEKAKELKAPVEIVIVKHAGHQWGNNKSGAVIEPSREEIVEKTVQFFVEHR